MTSIDSSNAILGADVFGVRSDSSLLLPALEKDSLNSDSASSLLRVEAEAMNLENYRIERIDFASGEAVASFVGEAKQEQGSASFNFNGKTGIYDVVVGYFDEDGDASLDPLLNGQSLGAIQLNKDLGGITATPNNFVRETIESGIFLDEWSVISILGFENSGEHARIDYVEFVWIGDLEPSSEPSEKTPSEKTVEQLDDQYNLPEALRINVGGDDYVDQAGQLWIADRYFEDGKTSTKDVSISNTLDDRIYQSGRYAKTMDYHIPVANGIYTVDLHFAETALTQPEQRTFDIEIEGEQQGDRVDIYKETGKNQAIEKSFTSILVTDGFLDLHLGAVKNYAQLAGIEVSAQAVLSSEETIRVNSGGDRYTDTNGNEWMADSFFDDGWTSNRDSSIQDTPNDPLYQSERYAKTLDYSVPVANGTYAINLLFAETYWSEAGKRTFDVNVEGQSVAEDLDIYQEAGKFKAYNQQVENVTVTDGNLDISLESSENYAKLSGFEIVPIDISTSNDSQNPPILPNSPSGVPSGAAPLSSGAAIRYISPEGRGNGASWAQAASIEDLDQLIKQSAPGDEIWIAGDLGTYNVGGKVISINSGGSASAPVYIRGVAAQQGGSDEPLFVGDRAKDWSPGKNDGTEVFRLLEGASYLHFSGLNFENVGNGAFRFGGDITGVKLQDMEAYNVRRFVENHVSGGADTASVSDLTIKDVEVRGFSKGAIRLQYDSRNILIEDVFGDAQGQDGDNFAMGVHLTGTVHDVIHRNVTMNNAIQTRRESEYWNADGFVTEWGTYNILYEDTFAAGSTDGGYDLKSQNTTLVRAGAADNKRNFRIWRDAKFIDVRSDEPFRRGGTGSTAHIHVLGDEGNVTIQGGTFSGDKDIENIIFDLDDKGSLTLDGATITDNNYVLKTVGQGDISLDNLKESSA